MLKQKRVIRYLAYSLEIILLFVMQTTPNFFPEIFGSKPLLLIPAALTISFMETELPAMFFGLGCGAALDLGYSGNIGYYSLMLTIICFGVSLVFRDYMVVSLRNAAAFIAAVSTALIGIHFLLFYLIAGKGEAGYYFLNHYISRIIYTIITGIGLYFLNRALYKGLRD